MVGIPSSRMNYGRCMQNLGPNAGPDAALKRLMSDKDELELALVKCKERISELEDKAAGRITIVNRRRILFTPLETEHLIVVELSDDLLNGTTDLFWRFNECLKEAATLFLDSKIPEN